MVEISGGGRALSSGDPTTYVERSQLRTTAENIYKRNYPFPSPNADPLFIKEQTQRRDQVMERICEQFKSAKKVRFNDLEVAVSRNKRQVFNGLETKRIQPLVVGKTAFIVLGLVTFIILLGTSAAPFLLIR